MWYRRLADSDQLDANVQAYPRLTRAKIIERLRKLASKHGFISIAIIHEHDPIAHRSIPLYFPNLAAARHAAGVPGPPYKKPEAKTGPKPGTKMAGRVRTWSRARVIEELRRLHRAGRRIALADLLAAGRVALVGAAQVYMGGLPNARRLAGISAPPRRVAARRWPTPAAVVQAIKQRQRKGQGLASSRTPQPLVNSARRHFGRWAAALAAAGIDAADVRVRPKDKYTKDTIIARLKRLARSGIDFRSVTLARHIKFEAVRREFGSINAAIHAAGLDHLLASRKHGLQRWDRARVIEVLRARAAKRVYTLTPGLHRVVQLYFGGAEAARTAAGVPSPVDIATRRRLELKFGKRKPERIAKPRSEQPARRAASKTAPTRAKRGRPGSPSS